MLPTGGPVEAFGEEPGLVPFGFVALHGLIEQIFGHPFQARVAHQPERVGYALLFAVVVEGGHGEARVGPYLSMATSGHLSLKAHTMRFKMATEEWEAWVFPALRSAVMRCPLSPSKKTKGW
jgi:hypothetical protein